MNSLNQVVGGFCWGIGLVLAATVLKVLFGFHFC